VADVLGLPATARGAAGGDSGAAGQAPPGEGRDPQRTATVSATVSATGAKSS
jgi:hypothetical protein